MSKKIVIIGAVAAGPKAACRLRRLQPDWEITMVDQDSLISYGGCGIPYYVSGDVSDESELRATSFHVVRDVPFFENSKGVKTRTRTRALAIDRKEKTVLVRNLDSGVEEHLPYDQLLLATGAKPFELPIPGSGWTACSPSPICTRRSRSKRESPRARSAGRWSSAAALSVSRWPRPDRSLGGGNHLAGTGAAAAAPAGGLALCRHAAAAPGGKGRGCVHQGVGHRTARQRSGQGLRVRTAQRTLEADLVIMAVGVRPRSELARAAGLDVAPWGGIKVNQRLQTSDPDIYAAGDCIAVTSLVTGRETYAPLGSLANREGGSLPTTWPVTLRCSRAFAAHSS
jgi:NADPH-dependent 2,4-dienoyl-CoA reductase/sulfur reductase-like enzyme